MTLSTSTSNNICFVIIQLLPPPTCPCRCRERFFLFLFSYTCCGWSVVHILVATSTRNLPNSPIISHFLAHPLPSVLNFVTQYGVKTKTFSSYEYGGLVGFVVLSIYSHHDSAKLSLVLLWCRVLEPIFLRKKRKRIEFVKVPPKSDLQSFSINYRRAKISSESIDSSNGYN